MLASLEEIINSNSIEINDKGDRIPLHSHTSLSQGLFIQEMFDSIKPKRSVEVGFAYGISAMFILEKHKQIDSAEYAHTVIEPDDYWGNAALHNIEKEGLLKYIRVIRDFSDKVLCRLFLENFRIQFAYIDTGKQFNTVMQDVYLIDKLLDVGGVIILDDCGGGCPGIQRVARFMNTLPHYTVAAKHEKIPVTFQRKLAGNIVSAFVKMIPFKKRLYPTMDFRSDRELGLNYSCIAFKKTGNDTRKWDWDKAL